jgi:hypothetical protein
MLSEFFIRNSNQATQFSPWEQVVALVILAVIFILLYIFREKRKKNKYEPENATLTTLI